MFTWYSLVVSGCSLYFEFLLNICFTDCSAWCYNVTLRDGKHKVLSLHFSLQFLNFCFFKSSSTWSSHLSLGLPTAPDEHGSHSVNFLTVLAVSILITCAARRNLHCDFRNLTIFFS